ncbi:MAG: glycosyltransferase family 39 protein [Oculatellaceae cyanobacterium Prado106]|jgi:uncharacterized membrane protein|nr:glycosyltransferase family 39 protein [Oculatellaceae cyanobacterium Prado106]
MVQLQRGRDKGRESRFENNGSQAQTLSRFLKLFLVLLLVAGVCFRFYNIDRKVYWLDEARTSLRMSGHTQTELVQEVFTGQVVDVATLQQYQRPTPTKTWGDTLHALKGNAEHTPLYFLLARLWTEGFGYSIANIRGLSVFFSLLVFPCLFWLCRELFESPAVAWMAMALVAVMPLQVLYAQEARPYSLWTMEILLSSAVLLWAMRSPQNRWRWLTYGITLVTGLYTQLLFGLVAIAHGLYVLVEEDLLIKRRWTPTAIGYSLATLGSLTALLPWLGLIWHNLDQVQEATQSLYQPYQFSTLINEWFLNLSRGFIDRELGSLNTLAVVLLAFFPLYYLCRKTSRTTWLFIITLVAVTFLALALPDIFLGGQRSLRIRYFIPSFLGLQIALAYLLVKQFQAKSWFARFWQLVGMAVIVGGLMACFSSAQAQVWWNKSIPRSAYYPEVSALINQSDRPLVISDSDPAEILTFSYWLDEKVKLQLVGRPRQLRVAESYTPTFLLNPSRRLRTRVKNQGYHLKRLYEDRSNPRKAEPRLWLAEKR